MYKELRKRIKASRPIAARQRAINIALLAIVLGSVAVFLWSVASVARANEQAQKIAQIEAFISTQNPFYYNGEGEIPYHIRYEMLELLSKCYGDLKANQLVFLLESKQMSFGDFASRVETCTDFAKAMGDLLKTYEGAIKEPHSTQGGSND